MEAFREPYITPEEYLEIEREAETKSEYYRGRVFAMAGASERHSTIQVNTLTTLAVQMKGHSCRAHGSDMRVKVSYTGLYTYPDASVVCGQARFEDKQRNCLLNPTVIVEVLSESTEAYDRGMKFDHYRSIESLVDYLLIWQDAPTIEHFIRQPGDRWLLTASKGLDAIVSIDSIDCKLPLAEIYDAVEFSSEERRSYLRRIKEPDAIYDADLYLPSPGSP